MNALEYLKLSYTFSMLRSYYLHTIGHSMPEDAPQESIVDRYMKKVGRPCKYDPEFHIPYMLEKSASDGYMVHDYCADWGIDESTFYDWARVHTEFSQAYRKSKMAQKKWWFNQARNGLNKSKGESFNATAWSMCMRNMGVSTDERKLSIDIEGCTPEQGIARVKKAISRGEITTKEGKTLIEMFAAERTLLNAQLAGNEMQAHIDALEEKLKEHAGKT